MSIQFIDLKAQYQHLQPRIDRRIAGVLAKADFILGDEVGELEEKLAEFVGVKHVISCANGTDALQLSLMTLGIGAGDAVFCPTFTFFASAEVIALAGATPIFVDVDRETFNLCSKDLARKIDQLSADSTLTPKAIMAVDLFGLPANFDELAKVAKETGMYLIEDAAQGFGGAIDARRACSFGDIATTSFFPAKPLGCYGDGGAVFTDKDDYADLLRSYRVHGKGDNKYHNVRVGLNSRLDTIQAAILLEKLEEFPLELKRRNEIAEHYSRSLCAKYDVPRVPTGYTSAWAQYTLRNLENRDHIGNTLRQSNIPSAVYYATCMHEQPVFDSLRQVSNHQHPVAESLARTCLSIPMHPYLSDAEVDTIVMSLLSC